jgi:hypothetical protein
MNIIRSMIKRTFPRDTQSINITKKIRNMIKTSLKYLSAMSRGKIICWMNHKLTWPYCSQKGPSISMWDYPIIQILNLMNVISNSLHVIRVSHLRRKQDVFSSTTPPSAHDKLNRYQHDILKVQSTHKHVGIFHSAYTNFVIPSTPQITWESIDEMDPGFNALLGQSGHLISIMEICKMYIMILISPYNCRHCMDHSRKHNTRIHLHKESLGLFSS